MLKNFKMGFNIGGLILFLIIMIPNFFWFAFPAPNDILRNESVTATLDMVASVCQVLIVITLCIFINKNSTKHKFSTLIIITIACCLLYFAGWIFYYQGVTNAVFILDLCISPCLAFLFYAFDRKNYIAVIPIVFFAICHTIFGVVNFII